MIETRYPIVRQVSHSDDFSEASFVVEPLDRGYGTTLGNALRRVLLSSLPGAAVTSIRIEGVFHEFSTIPGVIEDITEIILNIKGIRARMHEEGPKVVYIATEEGRSGKVLAGDIVRDDGIEIVNTDHEICTLNGDTRLFMELTMEWGRGYVPAERNKSPNSPIGVIPIDSIFTPVRKVNYNVADTRVGQITDFDSLTLDITTDGTLTAGEALGKAAEILIEHLSLFTGISNTNDEPEEDEDVLADEKNELLSTPIEDLDFTVRTYNCLKRANINEVADLVAKSERDMMKVRNLGKKSLEEVILKLEDLNLSLAEADE
jgi:DNA-directed RNA polymerase subunit alpha